MWSCSLVATLWVDACAPHVDARTVVGRYTAKTWRVVVVVVVVVVVELLCLCLWMWLWLRRFCDF